MTAHFAGCHDEPPPPLPHRWGKSLTEGASRMPGTYDSTLRQLKPPRPSCIEKPISSQHREPATYPNPHPLAQPSLETCIYKQTSNTVRARRFPRPAPPRSASPLKPLRHFLVYLVVFYLTLTLIETMLSFCIPSCIQKVPGGFTSSSGQGAC